MAPEVLGRLFAQHRELPGDGSDEALAGLPRGGGVVALTGAEGVLVQMLAAGSIRRAVAARWSPPAEERSRRVRLAGVVRRAWWQPAWSAFETHWLYLQRARQLFGGAYSRALGFAPVWYATLDARAEHPRWQAASALPKAGTVAAGPFATRRRCAAFIAQLEDLFDLCRYHEELIRAPHGKRCAYFDMGKCPAPCDGTVSMAVYREALARSADFATSDGAAFRNAQQEAMTRCAAALAFERAQQHRDAGERARAALAAPGRWARTPGDFCWLVVQRGPRRGVVRPFFCSLRGIAAGNDAKLNEISSAAPAWMEALGSSDKAGDISSAYASECLALVCHYLGKGERASGVYLNFHADVQPGMIAGQVQARFSRASREPGADDVSSG